MPLMKLWNAIWGRSARMHSPAAGGHSPATRIHSPATGGDSTATQTDVPAKRIAGNSQATTKVSRGPGFGSPGFRIFGGRPHTGLCKLVKSVPARSVLEISVEDGSRAIAVLETLAKTQENVRYVAIDPFEMASGAVTLMQFHQTLRAHNIRPQLLPGTIDRGLIRIAYTIGTVDLVLIAAPVQAWQTPQILPLLSRVSHSTTVILYLDGEAWKQFHTAPASLRRAA